MEGRKEKMNETLTMWEVPKGQFDSAMLKLAGVLGKKFGTIVNELNGKHGEVVAQVIAERLTEPERAFARRILNSPGDTALLEKLEEEFLWKSDSENSFNDRIVRRAIALRERSFPSLPPECTEVHHWPSLIEIINGSIDDYMGMATIQSLVYELTLRLYVRASQGQPWGKDQIKSSLNKFFKGKFPFRAISIPDDHFESSYQIALMELKKP